MQGRVTVFLLVEDARQANLVRSYLKLCGIGPREIRISISPSGRGSAEGWVRRQFPLEVHECRTRHAQTRVIVVVDADVLSVAERMRQFDEALRAAELPPLHESDGVARLVPKRNVETWVLCLNGELVHEEEDYKRARNDWDKLIHPAAGTLYGWTRANARLPDDCIASLRVGVEELRGLEL
jgi:hypothetical protein